MNREALQELFDYTTFTWAAYRETMRSMPPEALLQPVDGSGWPSLRDALFHIASAWDEWLCEETGAVFTPVEATDVTTWDELDAIRATLRPLLRKIIDDTRDEVMDAPNEGVTGARGRTPRDLVTHMLLHERGHHGDISTLLSALGVEPPIIDYLVYAFFRDHTAQADAAAER